MNRSALLVPLLSLVACIDYDPRIEPLGPSVPYPPVEESPIQVDRTLQVPQPQVDVLFVVDNSCSMAEEQQQLGENFPGFMQYFADSGLDFHIGVISTDMTDPSHRGKLRQIGGNRYIDEDTENPEQVFSMMANMGTGGAYEEKGRAAAYTALELNAELPRNEGFAREDAALHLVFISDEEDQSGSNPISRQEFLAWMANHKASPDLVTAHAIVGLPGQSCAAIDTVGAQYAQYAEVTAGIAFSLCQPDWEPLLDELGLQTSGLKREYFLTKIPVIDPLELRVQVKTERDGAEVTIDFRVCLAEEAERDPSCQVVYTGGRNSITFLDYLPDPQSEVIATYSIRDVYERL